MPQKNREDSFTEVTSISVSKYFKDLIRKYNLSPTEVFRIGMGAVLCEMRVSEYDTELNRRRLLESKEFLNNLSVNDEITSKFNELKIAVEKVGELLK
ncbi:MAG: hypothetical protein KKF54_04645 [Candidatus Omnitrophica bacterium]|nr:hypothetical protein [Candidatus Omnitrophota bacterium]